MNALKHNGQNMDGETVSILKETSIAHFGFVTNRPSRMREYSWIINELEDYNGETVVDIGAGTSPVPIILATYGWVVDTIDYWREDTFDEWGFINYGLIHKDIRSHNMDFALFGDERQFDVIYSISAIEHMTARTRRKVFKNVFDLLVSDGVFLATMDVRQHTDEIHNRNYGQQIEKDHGTISDIVNELHDIGFDGLLFWVEEFDGQGQDVLFIKAVK